MDTMQSNFFLQSSKKHHNLDNFELDLLEDKDIKALFETYTINMKEVLYVVQSSFNLILHATLKEHANMKYQQNKMSVIADVLRGKCSEGTQEMGEETQRRTDKQIEEEGFPDEDILNQVASTLNSLEHDQVIEISNYSVLRQSVVIIWSATESLIRDVIRTLLNHDIELANKFFESSDTKPYWNKKNITYDHLRNNNFNVQENMGDIALEINPCSYLNTMKSAFLCLFGHESKSYVAIKGRSFFLLYKLRNVIAHRNGIVDEKYKLETGFDGQVGERIKVMPDDFTENYLASKKLAISLLQELSNK